MTMTLDQALALADLDCPLPALGGKALRVLRDRVRELEDVVQALDRAADEDLIANTSHEDTVGVLSDAAKAALLPGRDTDGFYLACFKHGSYDGYLYWWGPNNCGYTPDLCQAGIYATDEIKAGYHDSDHTVPIPVALVDRFRVRRMVDMGDTLNAPLATAERLRAWLARLQEAEGNA